MKLTMVLYQKYRKKNQDFFNKYLEPNIVFPNESSAEKKL